MTKKKKPVLRTKLHNSKKVVTNKEYSVLEGSANSEAQKIMAERARKATETKQEDIDLYNRLCSTRIDPFFKNIQLTGRDIIVKLHKENWIKKVTEYANGSPLYDAWVSQVDGRETRAGSPKWMDNPLPYVYTGVVVAMSPMVKAEFLKEQKELEEIDPELARDYKVLEVGDIIHMQHFMYADKRFYKDKQQRDFINNPKEYRIEHWEGYVTIHIGLIEAIVKKPDTFDFSTSPYAQYKFTGVTAPSKSFAHEA